MNKEANITALFIAPKCLPKTVTIENELSALQNCVGGLIECFDLPNGTTIIVTKREKSMDLSQIEPSEMTMENS